MEEKTMALSKWLHLKRDDRETNYGRRRILLKFERLLKNSQNIGLMVEKWMDERNTLEEEIQLIVTKFGWFGFGGHGGGGHEEILRLQHTHVPDLHKFESIFFRVITGIVHCIFGALYRNWWFGSDGPGQIERSMQAGVVVIEDAADQSKLSKEIIRKKNPNSCFVVTYGLCFGSGKISTSECEITSQTIIANNLR